ncbi:PQQ-binding-like beta-propeller repeat protein [Aldersonia sp. NBC_00410]|uniref:Rv3212 family protein n=1 Tax=Aldersonia sp. NBC_00410 TaxID=2975954 RepID=UPI00225A751D|nr:PQQ-binding-like beta-propeller repeat protein [Aldersonia sp. NBC_00410]MCX5044575.1 PQQ-binding-like beta-propeller repeat protein [Aldersonia sp. NBC_00410]
MPAPERRSRADLLVAALIVLVVVVAVVVVWQRSDAHSTASETAKTPVSQAPTALSVPPSVQEKWRAHSSAADAPIVTDGAVVTADDGEIVGHDPADGAPVWRYRRDAPLCGAIGAWGTAVAVYRDARGCSQVTELAGADGRRTAQRTSYADDTVTLSEDGTYVLSQGPTRLELWRSDLVRTLEYGYVDAPVNPKSQPRSGCTLHSSASSGSRLAVLERCPGEAADRLSVLNTNPKDPTKPEEYGSAVLADLVDAKSDGRVLAASGDRVAVYVPGDGAARGPYIGIYDSGISELARYPLSEELPADAVAESVPGAFLLWTGAAVVALRAADLAPLWSALDAIGPGTAMAGSVIVPVRDAIAVINPMTGKETARLPVDRTDKLTGPIRSAVAGNLILEQRGDELVALG